MRRCPFGNPARKVQMDLTKMAGDFLVSIVWKRIRIRFQATNIPFSTAMRRNQGKGMGESLERGFFASLTRRMELRDSAKGATDCCCHGDADLPPQNQSELTKDRRNHRETSFLSQTATPAWIEGAQEKMLDSWTTRLNDTFPCTHSSSSP